MSSGSPAPILIFDGDCGFCTTVAQWTQERLHHGERVEAWQLLAPDILDSFGLDLHDVEQAAWWVDADGRLARGHRAIGRALLATGGWRRGLGRLFLIPPTSWLAAGLYRLVVRWRHRLPGGTPACRIDARRPPGGGPADPQVGIPHGPRGRYGPAFPVTKCLSASR